ncbi:MAG: hypothetical protein AAF655_24230 [Bacteroidota bacterium]
MKNIHIHLFTFSLLFTLYSLLSAFTWAELPTESVGEPETIDLKQQAFTLLQQKCNLCHKKQNPFKVFSLKNMEKYAKKIHHQVFVLKRMPKGDDIQLTEEEYQILEKWLDHVVNK